MVKYCLLLSLEVPRTCTVYPHTLLFTPLPYEVLPGPWPLPLLLTHYKYKIYFFSHQRDIRTLTTHQLSPLQVFALQAATLGPERAAGCYGNVSGRPVKLMEQWLLMNISSCFTRKLLLVLSEIASAPRFNYRICRCPSCLSRKISYEEILLKIKISPFLTMSSVLCMYLQVEETPLSISFYRQSRWRRITHPFANEPAGRVWQTNLRFSHTRTSHQQWKYYCCWLCTEVKYRNESLHLGCWIFYIWCTVSPENRQNKIKTR